MNRVIPGSRWEHYNGNQYTVLLLANTASTRPEYPTRVIYQGDNGNVWEKTADEFLVKMHPVGVEGSAGAPGETTSPEISIPEYKVGDTFMLRGELVTIDEVMASPGCPPQYSWVFPKGRGSEGCYTAAEIAHLRARYGDA